MNENKMVVMRQNGLFGPAPVITGEDRSAYDQCFKRISAAVKPQDFLMEMWVSDIVNLTWDIIRYRRAKTDFVSAALFEKIRRQFSGKYDVAQKWASRDPVYVMAIENELAKLGLSTQALMAEVLVNEIEKIA